MSWWDIIKEPTLSTSAGFTPALHNTTYGENPPCETCEDKETPCGCKIEKKSDSRYFVLLDKLMQDGKKRTVNGMIDGLLMNRGNNSLRNLPSRGAFAMYLRGNKNYDATKRSPKQYKWVGVEI